MTAMHEEMSLVDRLKGLLTSGNLITDDVITLANIIKNLETNGNAFVEDAKAAKRPTKKKSAGAASAAAVGARGWPSALLKEGGPATVAQLYERGMRLTAEGKMNLRFPRDQAEAEAIIQNQLSKGSQLYRKNADGTWWFLKAIKASSVA